MTRMKLMVTAFLVLALAGTAGASKKCGNSYIADNKICRIGTATPYVAPAPVRVMPVAAPVGFSSCDAAQAAGYSDMRLGSLYYRPDLDRDKDGVACESAGEGEAPSAASTSSASASAQGIEYVDLGEFCLQNGVTMGSEADAVTLVRGAVTVRILVGAQELLYGGLYVPMSGKMIGTPEGFAAPLADMQTAFPR